MKKTFTVEIGNEQFIIALMNDMQWKEIDRVSSGGMMSPPVLLLTFEGHQADLNENKYIESDNGYCSIFYSIEYPNGHQIKDVEEFKKSLKALKIGNSLEIKTLQLD